MSAVESTALPAIALSNKYGELKGAYLDCFKVKVESTVTLEEFVLAFYTTAVFKVERFILHHLAKMPSSDIGASKIAAGSADRFAAWTVEERITNQLLMCDVHGVTRSWFMVTPTGTDMATTLYFGSVIVPVKNSKAGDMRIGRVYRMLLGFHRVYSRVLLFSAKSRLKRLNKSSAV